MTIQEEIKQALSSLATVSELLCKLMTRDTELSCSYSQEIDRYLASAYPLDRRQDNVDWQLNQKQKG